MHKTCKKIMAILFIIVALVLAVLVSTKEANLNLVIAISRFFDVMIPVLAVGALVKYLLGCSGSACCKQQGDKCSCGNDPCTCKQESCQHDSCSCK